MLPNDSIETASNAAKPFTDSRVYHFFDPKKKAGMAIADSLNWVGRIAWDIYLYYGRGQEWTDLPPSPINYYHQLTNDWADRDHYRVGNDLTESLMVSMGKIIQTK